MSTLPTKFNGMCFSCVHNNFRFCDTDKYCRSLEVIDGDILTQSCAGTEYIKATGCPPKTICEDAFGISGIVQLSSTTVPGGINPNEAGSITFDVNADYPCYLGLQNVKNAKMIWDV